jgi:hypothetical protein
MSELKFSSRVCRSATPARLEPDFEEEMASFIEEVRALVRNDFQLSQVTAVDQISFWNSPSVLRSYAPIGG